MNSKKWVKIFLILSFLSILPVILANYIIDPLWLFSHSNRYNNIQAGFNERQQKTNYIHNQGFNNFDSILLGSSRTTFVNQNDFRNMKIYNYALSRMFPYEYKGYIDFTKKVIGKELKHIIIGADFFGTNVPRNLKVEKPEFYINKTTSFLYKYNMLLSIDVLKKSIKNFKNSFRGGKRYYDRNNIKYQQKVTEKVRKRVYTKNLRLHTLELSNPHYTYNDDYINILKQIKKDNPNSKFIIFTPAVTSDLLVSILKNARRIDELERWLKEIIDVFGEVNHFMTINSITENLENYPDDDHAYPYIMSFIANKLSNHKNEAIPKDFGIVLTKKNVDSYLESLKKEIKEYKTPKI